MGPMSARDHQGAFAWMPMATGLLAAAVIAAAVIAARAQPDQPLAPDREVLVHLLTGEQVLGVLIESNEQYLVLRVGSIRTTIDMKDVAQVEVQPTLEEQYHDLRDSIADSDLVSLLRLAEWLIQKNRPDLAMAEVDRVLERDPRNFAASKLRRQIVAQIELRNAGRRPGPRPPVAQPPDDPYADFPLLNESQINIIKVFEIDSRDPPKLQISRATIQKMMELYAGDPLIPATHEGRQAMFRRSPEEILDIMFRLRARELYGEVKVLGHPESMSRFKADVHRPWLLTRCATDRCHGGTGAGGLRLYNRRGKTNTDAAVYTNFLILNRFRTKDGQALIDVEDAARSPLLQLGLPRQHSVFPHPEVLDEETGRDLFRPAFRSSKDRRYQQAIAWIQSLYRPRVEYPVGPIGPDAAGPASPADTPPTPAEEPGTDPPGQSNSGGGG